MNTNSALLGLPGEHRGFIKADHLGMAKFSTRNTEYKKILHAVKTLLEALPNDVLTSTQGEHKLCITCIKKVLNQFTVVCCKVIRVDRRLAWI